MKFGIHNPSWVYGPDPTEAFEAVKAKAQWAENHGFVWFSVMDHLIEIPGVGAPDEPFMEGWTALAGLATALLLGLWIRRRAGSFAGVLAGILLLFSFLYVFIGMTFAADAFLTFALLAASILLDRATRAAGSDALQGAVSGAALAIAFGFKGLVGIVLPVGPEYLDSVSS